MAWTARTASKGSGNGSTVTVTKPTGLVDGDIYSVWVFAAGNTTTVTTPTGWTQSMNGSEAGFGSALYHFYKTASGEGASQAFTLSGVTDYSWEANGYAGGAGTLTGTQSIASRAAGSTTYTSPSITPVANGALLVAGFFFDNNATMLPATPSASPAATLEASNDDASSHQNEAIEYYVQPSAAALALNMTFASASNVSGLTGMIAFTPAVTSTFIPKILSYYTA